MSETAPKYFGTLKIKDRLDYPTMLYKTIVASVETARDIEKSDLAVETAIKLIVSIVPDAWKDEKFSKESAAAAQTKIVDIRPLFCGKPASLEYCKAHGIQPFQRQVTYDYNILLQSLTNLLDRLHLFARRTYTERMTGRRYHGKESEDLAETGEFNPGEV